MEYTNGPTELSSVFLKFPSKDKINRLGAFDRSWWFKLNECRHTLWLTAETETHDVEVCVQCGKSRSWCKHHYRAWDPSEKMLMCLTCGHDCT